MTRGLDPHKGEVATALNLSDLASVAVQAQGSALNLVESCLAVPLKGLGPGFVAKPVADVIGVTLRIIALAAQVQKGEGQSGLGKTYSIDQNRNLLHDTRHQAMERLHPVALEQEVPVDVEVAALIAANLNAKSRHDLFLVEVFADVTKHGIAEITAVLTFAADVIDVLASALIRSDHGIIAIDRGGNARPDALAVVAVLDERQTARKGVVHGLAFALVEDGWPSSVTAGHWAIVGVLSVAVS